MTTLEKVATYLRTIANAQDLSQAQADARLALRLIQEGKKKCTKD